MIKSELERVHNHFDAIIGSHATFPDIRKESRDIVFELIAIENSLNIESDIAIRSAIATVNKQIADPKFRIKLNLKSAAEIKIGRAHV